MDEETLKLVATSAVVAAIVGGLVTFLSQHRLLARKAELDYEFEAKKRLHEAVGPFRLQLLLAARDLIRRVRAHHSTNWNMKADGYYVKSFVYRFLSPIAVGQLVQQKMSVVDFTVDPYAIELLKFLAAVDRMLTGNDVILKNPDTDWSRQTQHLFRDNLRAAAATLIISQPDSPERLMNFAEFDATYNLLDTDELADLGRIFDRCESSLVENPIFWVRLIGYAFACSSLICSDQAKSLGFTARSLPIEEMILAIDDDYYKSRLDSYISSLNTTLAEGF